MTINIDNQDVTLKYTFRGFMIFENITGDGFNGKNLTEFITLFYSMVMASDSQLAIDFDHFIEWLDANPEELQNFSEWIASNIKKQNELSPRADQKEPAKKTTKKK